MESEFASDMLIVLEEWRLVIIVVCVSFLAWALWYTSGRTSTRPPGVTNGKRMGKNGESGENGEPANGSVEQDEYGNGEEEDAEEAAARARAAESRRVAVESTLRRPLSLAEEIVAIHNIIS
jgi:hypothetical protein